MSSHYTLTFVPGCNKNIYYMKVVAEGTNDEIVKKLNDIVGDSLEQICDPFCEYEECEECLEREDGCNKKCVCFNEEKCFGFNESEERAIHEKIKISKDFVYYCQCRRDHFRIDEWRDKSQFNKKQFLNFLRSKVF